MAKKADNQQDNKPCRRDKKKVRRIYSANKKTKSQQSRTFSSFHHDKPLSVGGQRRQFHQPFRSRLDWRELYVHKRCEGSQGKMRPAARSQHMEQSARPCFCLFGFKLCTNTRLSRQRKSKLSKQRAKSSYNDMKLCMYNLPTNMEELRLLLKSTNIKIIRKNNITKQHQSTGSNDNSTPAVCMKSNKTSFLVLDKLSGAHLSTELAGYDTSGNFDSTSFPTMSGANNHRCTTGSSDTLQHRGN